jgi:O-antigen/teichoic acid export membrane protein
MNKTNVAWNIFGLGAPLMFAVIAIPLLLQAIGNEKFGIFMLAWGLVGFSSILDLGIGRATTHELSRRNDEEVSGRIGIIFGTAERIACTSGLFGMIGIIGLTQLKLHQTLNYSPELENDIIWSAWIVALTMPLQVVSAMYRGVNEAYGQYRGISIIRVALGVANFLLPAIVSLFSTNLTLIIATLLVSRLAALLAFRMSALLQIEPDILLENRKIKFDRIAAISLMRFGLWNTVSSILNPLMAQGDRFIIGVVLTVSAVAAYTIPYEIATKLLIIPGAVTTVLFPTITAFLVYDQGKALRLFWRWFFITTGAMVIVVVAFYSASPWLLSMWLGSTLPAGAISVAKIIAVGLVPYTMGTLLVSLVHAFRRPDITAKSHILQAPIYIFGSIWAIQNYQIEGAAVMWALRQAVDALILGVWVVGNANNPFKKSAILN